MVLALAALSHAQNLGLGTGSRSGSDSEDSSMETSQGSGGRYGEEESPPRKKQINRRLGLLGRKSRSFDPKVYEERGKELQGQFYEIGTAPSHGHTPGSGTGGMSLPQSGMAAQSRSPRQWMIWVGIAGAAGASAGALGFFMMNQAHPPSAPPPKILDLSDDPAQP